MAVSLDFFAVPEAGTNFKAVFLRLAGDSAAGAISLAVFLLVLQKTLHCPFHRRAVGIQAEAVFFSVVSITFNYFLHRI